MKTIFVLIFLASMVSLSTSVSAELFINPANKASAKSAVVEANYTISKADYEISAFGKSATGEVESANGKSATGEVERKIISGTVAYGINDILDAFAAFGFITESKGEDATSDEALDGTLMAFGVSGVLPIGDDVDLHGYGQYLATKEEGSSSYTGYASGTEKGEVDITEIGIGVAALWKKDKLKGYVGGELVVSSSGNITYTDNWSTYNASGVDKYEAEVKRSDMFIVRLGGSYDAGSGFSVNAALALLGANTFSIGVSKDF